MKALLLAGGAALFLWGAACNRFPLVYNDTGTYLRSGTAMELPLDRPIYYGFFLRAARAGSSSLWLPIVAQALILSWLLLLLMRKVRPEASTGEIGGIGALLALGTALPWFCGQLMADIFTGYLALAVYLLVVHRASLRRSETVMLGALFAASLMVHSAHPPIAALLLALLATERRYRGGLRLPAILLLAVLVAVPAANKALEKDGFRPRYTPTWLMARLLDDGIAVRLLEEHCGERNYSLCPHVEALRGKAYTAYFWLPDSPLNRIGGWDHSAAATWPIVIDAGRYYPLDNALSIAGNFVRQFFSYATGDGLWGYESSSFVSRVIREDHPGSEAAFAGSRQQRGTLPSLIGPLSKLHALVAAAALLLAALSLLPLPLRLSPKTRDLLGYSVVFCAVHALVCGAILVTDRFQARVIWLIVLAAAPAGLELAFRTRTTSDSSPAARPLLALAAAVPAGAVLVALLLRLTSSTIVRTAPSEYFQKPVLVWPGPDHIVKTIPLSSFADTAGLTVGARLKSKLQSGREYVGTVTEVRKDAVSTRASWEMVRW